VPFASTLEQAWIPSGERVAGAVMEVMGIDPNSAAVA
jgi:hypothetical protein